MTVKRELRHDEIRTYTGLSTDVKPTDCPIGSTFHELNTGANYRFNGESWYIATQDIGLVWDTETLAPVKQQNDMLSAEYLSLTANNNISQYGGVNVGAGNGFYVRPGTGAEFELAASDNIVGKIHLVETDDNDIGPIHPLHIASDAVYHCDINTVTSTSVGWTGLVTNPFLDMHTEIYNTNATNPKVLYIEFYRALYLNAVGLGCMAVQLAIIKKDFIGLSTDTKPTELVAPNSSFYEYDTGKTYVYTGSSWEQK